MNENNLKKQKCKSIKKHWSLREKRIVLSILQKHGDTDIQKFINALPSKSRFQISAFLNRNKKAAEMKVNKMHSSLQNDLQDINQWLPVISIINNGAESILDKNLPALILPIIRKYSQHPDAQKSGNVDFSMAYKFLFNSLTNTPIPNTMFNDETIAALLACTSQLVEEIRNKAGEGSEMFGKFVCNKESRTKENEEDVLSMPEINSFHWTKEEIELFCAVKT